MNEHNIFSSDETKDQCNTCYGEMHTGESWHRANNHYCPHIGDAPIALIIFAKNSHTDLHGVLSITPVFALSFFNSAVCNNSKSGAKLHTNSLCHVAKGMWTRPIHTINYKTSITVLGIPSKN